MSFAVQSVQTLSLTVSESEMCEITAPIKEGLNLCLLESKTWVVNPMTWRSAVQTDVTLLKAMCMKHTKWQETSGAPLLATETDASHSAEYWIRVSKLRKPLFSILQLSQGRRFVLQRCETSNVKRSRACYHCVMPVLRECNETEEKDRGKKKKGKVKMQGRDKRVWGRKKDTSQGQYFGKLHA